MTDIMLNSQLFSEFYCIEVWQNVYCDKIYCLHLALVSVHEQIMV